MTGTGDLLSVLNDPAKRVVRDFIEAQGDRVLHFSAYAAEVRGDRVLQRLLIVTDRALLVVPHTALESGIFFSCRTELAELTQVILVDKHGAQVFKKPQASLSSTQLAVELQFNEEGVRKGWLSALGIAAPFLPILQKRTALEVEKDVRPGSDETVLTVASLRSSDERHCECTASPLPKVGEFVSLEISEDEFRASVEQLHNLLQEADLNYDVDVDARARPTEEALSRLTEREKIKAMLDHREKKIIQNIEFKLKYPTKVATIVPPGVDYDKAHEERLVLPDDISEIDLLGPSLYPLWSEWKSTGGLLGRDGRVEWNLYSSNDLIESLREREDVVFGHVGPNSLAKLAHMRDLVVRERNVFLNKFKAARSPTKVRTPQRKVKVFPFNLSQSPTSLKTQLRLVNRQQVLLEMKKGFDSHLRTLHELRKQQLERELERTKGI